MCNINININVKMVSLREKKLYFFTYPIWVPKRPQGPHRAPQLIVNNGLVQVHYRHFWLGTDTSLVN